MEHHRHLPPDPAAGPRHHHHLVAALHHGAPPPGGGLLTMVHHHLTTTTWWRHQSHHQICRYLHFTTVVHHLCSSLHPPSPVYSYSCPTPAILTGPCLKYITFPHIPNIYFGTGLYRIGIRFIGSIFKYCIGFTQ